MSELTTIERPTLRPGLRSALDLLNWDPFRGLVGNLSQGPSFEVERNDEGYQLELPVPGFSPEQIEATVNDGILNVVGKNDRRNFTRTISLPDEIDSDRIEAHVEHGMLTLKLPLHPKAQPKKIAVRG